MRVLFCKSGIKITLCPNNYSGLLTMTTWAVFGVIIVWSYTSCLVTSLTVVETETPLDYWPQLFDRGYKIYMIRGSLSYAIVQVLYQFS